MLKQLLKNEKARQHGRGTVDRLTFQAENRICSEFEIENIMSRALASKRKVEFNENEEMGRWSPVGHRRKRVSEVSGKPRRSCKRKGGGYF